MEGPDIQIEWFCLHKWFENLNSFKTSYSFRADNEYHVIHLERGFYYVLSRLTDLPVLREILYYVLHLCQEPMSGFKNFDALLQKNVHLLIDRYISLGADDIDDVFHESEIEPYITYRTEVVDHLASLRDLDGVITYIKKTCIINPLQLAWRLVTINNFDAGGAIVYTANADKILSDIISLRYDDYSMPVNTLEGRMQRLEKVGADFAFFSKVLSPKMAEIFMQPICDVKDYNGWHANYCQNILSRLIFPILNIIGDGIETIDEHSFRSMLLLFLQMYSKKGTLVLFNTQLKRALRLFTGIGLEHENTAFRAALKNLGWSGKTVDKYPWKM